MNAGKGQLSLARRAPYQLPEEGFVAVIFNAMFKVAPVDINTSSKVREAFKKCLAAHGFDLLLSTLQPLRQTNWLDGASDSVV